MMQLSQALNAWGTATFKDTLKQEIEQLGVEQLPLQQALTRSNYAIDSNINAMIINVAEETNNIRVKAGIFYSAVIAGCTCEDDPTPASENNEYCVVQFDINKKTAETSVTLLDEQ